MLDIKMIRQNTDEIKERLATRGVGRNNRRFA